MRVIIPISCKALDNMTAAARLETSNRPLFSAVAFIWNFVCRFGVSVDIRGLYRYSSYFVSSKELCSTISEYSPTLGTLNYFRNFSVHTKDHEIFASTSYLTCNCFVNLSYFLHIVIILKKHEPQIKDWNYLSFFTYSFIQSCTLTYIWYVIMYVIWYVII